MNSVQTLSSPWDINWIKQHPIRFLGVILHLVLRTLFAIFWLVAGINKINKDWLTTDIVKDIFMQRLTELPPDSFAVFYLQTFAIPLHNLVAWAVTIGEIYSGLALLLGWTNRWAAGVALFILVNFSLGGYYDASLIPFYLLTFAFMVYPSGHWLGLDRYFIRKYPGSILFR